VIGWGRFMYFLTQGAALSCKPKVHGIANELAHRPVLSIRDLPEFTELRLWEKHLHLLHVSII
jgi:hypothetical protein